VKDIPVWRFLIGKEVFYKSKQNAENECYCTYDIDQRSHKFCEINGIFDLSKCQLNTPVFISAPHFLYADRRLLEMVDGLKPIQSEHSSYLNIEPVKHLNNFDLLRNKTKTFLTVNRFSTTQNKQNNVKL
jgi:hypothetical protein